MGVHPGEKRGAKGTDLGGQFIGPKSVAKFLMKLLGADTHGHGEGKPAADERRTMGRFVTGGGSVISARLPERKARIDDRVVDTNDPRRLGTVASVLPDGSHRVHWDDGTHSVQPAGTVTTPLRESGRSFDAHTSPAVAKMTAKPPRPLTPTEHLAEQVAAGHVSSRDAAELMRLRGSGSDPTRAKFIADRPAADARAADARKLATEQRAADAKGMSLEEWRASQTPSKAVAKVAAAKRAAPAKAAKKAAVPAKPATHAQKGLAVELAGIPGSALGNEAGQRSYRAWLAKQPIGQIQGAGRVLGVDLSGLDREAAANRLVDHVMEVRPEAPTVGQDPVTALAEKMTSAGSLADRRAVLAEAKDSELTRIARETGIQVPPGLRGDPLREHIAKSLDAFGGSNDRYTTLPTAAPAKKAVPKAETGVHPAVEKMLRLGTPPRMTERGPLPGERPKVGAPKQAAPDIKQVEMHLASVGVNSPTSTAEDEARKYIDDLKLSAAQMKQLGKDLGVPSLSTASKAQLRDDIVKVHVTGRVRTRAIGEMYRQPDAASHPDGLDSMEPTALGKYAREFDVQTSGKTPDEIKAALRAQGVGSPQVEAAKRAAEEAAKPVTAPRLTDAQIEDRIRAAHESLARRPDAFTSLTDIRQQLTGISREDQDRVIIHMTQTPGVLAVPESNQKMLKQADRDAAAWIGNQQRHLLKIDPSAGRTFQHETPASPSSSRAVAKVTAARKAAPATRAPKPLPRGQHDALKTMDAGGGSAPAALLTPSVSKALERDGLIRRDGNSVTLTDQGRSALSTRAPAARPDFAAKAAEVRRVGGDQQAIQEQLSGLSASDLHSLAYELNLSVPSAARSAPARRLFIAQSLSQHFRRTSGGL